MDSWLVLSRKAGEEVCIGNGITVRVLGINGNRVRLGFKAPQEETIYRPDSQAKKESRHD